MYGRWKTARVLLVEADEIYLPALQQYVAATCQKRWGQNWYEEWAGHILDIPELSAFKRKSFEDKLEEVRTSKEQSHHQLEHYDFAKTVGGAVHAVLFPNRWTGKHNATRVQNAKKTMDELSRHRTHWSTFEDVVGLIIPAWIKVLELLPDVRPAQELRELEEEARTGLSSDQLQLMEQAAQLGRTRAIAFRQLPDETESAWFERMHSLDSMVASDTAAQLSVEDHSAFEAEVERQLKHYTEMLPVTGEIETIRRREECRTQLSLELSEAEKEGLTWRQLHAWRQHRVWREQYGEDLEMWEEYVLQVLEAVDLGLTDEQLESWRLHQFYRELNGLDWEVLESAQQETSVATRLHLSPGHLHNWRHYQMLRELEGFDRHSLGDELQRLGSGGKKHLLRWLTPEFFQAWLASQLMREWLHAEPRQLDEKTITEMKGWSRWKLPPEYLGVWWAYQDMREEQRLERQPVKVAQEMATRARDEGIGVHALYITWANQLLKPQGLRIDIKGESTYGSYEEAKARSRDDIARQLTRQLAGAAAEVRRLAPKEEEMARQAGLSGLILEQWWYVNWVLESADLSALDADVAAREWKQARTLGATASELGVWWLAQSYRESLELPRESVVDGVTEVKRALGLGMAPDELVEWWEAQSVRDELELPRRSVEDGAREVEEARKLGMSIGALGAWWDAQAYRETKKNLSLLRIEDGAREARVARDRGMTDGKLWAWWNRQTDYESERNAPLPEAIHMYWIRVNRDFDGRPFSEDDAVREWRIACLCGLTDVEVGTWWAVQAVREAGGLERREVDEGASEEAEARHRGMSEEQIVIWQGVQLFRELPKTWELRDLPELRPLPTRPLKEGADEVQEARGLGVSDDELEAWWLAQSVRESMEWRLRVLEEDIPELEAARSLGMTSDDLFEWWYEQSVVEAEDRDKEDIETWWEAKQVPQGE